MQADAAPKPSPVDRKAAAKINLYLHVTGRRESDGFHLLDSLVVFVDVGDDLSVAPAAGLDLELDGPFGPELARTSALEDNLVLRAARLLRRRVGGPGVGPGARIRLSKNLPVAAGMGGGSADAAATLSALNDLWGLDLPMEDLLALGLELGADVPACIAAVPVLVSGVGEELTAAPKLPDMHAVLVNPGIALSTADVFGALKPQAYGGADPLLRPVADLAGLADALSRRRNDLEAPAVGLVPEIVDVLGALGDLAGCRFARMSGSGATCFGLFATTDDAARASALIANRFPRWWAASGAVLKGCYRGPKGC